jgi:ribosomal protein S17E
MKKLSSTELKALSEKIYDNYNSKFKAEHKNFDFFKKQIEKLTDYKELKLLEKAILKIYKKYNVYTKSLYITSNFVGSAAENLRKDYVKSLPYNNLTKHQIYNELVIQQIDCKDVSTLIDKVEKTLKIK